ncbi:MAG: hypothetical protein ABIQ95_05265, partial [Bdellovibrionia bacterium]
QLNKPEGVGALHSQLSSLTTEAGQLRKDARDANLKSLERSAESLGQMLNSAHRNLLKLTGISPDQATKDQNCL